MSRKVLVFGLLALVLAVLAGAGYFIHRAMAGETVRIGITQSMIDLALAKKFPKEKTYLKIIRVTYANPRAILMPDQDRVRVGIDVSVRIGITGLEKTYQGSATLTTKIGYRPEDHKFTLREPAIEALDIPKMSADTLVSVREGLNIIVTELSEEIPVYQLTGKDTKTDLAKLLLKDVSIRRDKVVVTVGL